jgi:hypothetical protein
MRQRELDFYHRFNRFPCRIFPTLETSDSKHDRILLVWEVEANRCLECQKEDNTVLKFIAFHRAHPHIFQMFCEVVERRLREGWQRCGAMAILEELRNCNKWALRIQTDDKYKLNNSHAGHYARLYLALYPDKEYVFKTRKPHAKYGIEK